MFPCLEFEGQGICRIPYRLLETHHDHRDRKRRRDRRLETPSRAQSSSQGRLLSLANEQVKREAEQRIALTREQSARASAEEQSSRLRVLVDIGGAFKGET
jgi:hypothetical protein